jgi:hypothetical protein
LENDFLAFQGRDPARPGFGNVFPKGEFLESGAFVGLSKPMKGV